MDDTSGGNNNRKQDDRGTNLVQETTITQIIDRRGMANRETIGKASAIG